MHQQAKIQSELLSQQMLMEVTDLSFAYPDGTQALTSINLRINAGERIALVGHNGSGKTTLVKQLCGLLSPGQGEIKYLGQSLEGDHLAQSRLKIGLLFQDPDDQLFGHSIYDDVAFGPRNQGRSETEVDRIVRQVIAEVGLDELLYKPPHALSYGQKKRAALAGLLAMQPDLLILDEPTANLDPAQEQVFLGLLQNFPGTLLLISHDLIFLYELCERALVLDRGHVHHDYLLKELVEHRPSLREHGLDFSFRFAENPALPSVANNPEIHPVPEGRCKNQCDEVLVDMREVSYRYPDGTAALKGIDLQIRRGERVALVGENGAGKSTLLMCLLGLNAFVGNYRFADRPIHAGKGRMIWQQTGMVFQDSADQLVCPTCYDEVAFAPRQYGYSEDQVKVLVEKALRKVKLDGFDQRIPLHLSGGERKRLALASVLSLEPQLLILDEPTAGLDPQGEELLLEIIREIDATLVLVSHDIFFVRQLTERVLVMHHGQIAIDYPLSDFLNDKNLTTLNGLDYTYRDQCALQIRALQHRHEHAHSHKHLHDHSHRHGELVHQHPHEHEHEHEHSYIHRHNETGEHQHPIQSEYHDHDHPGHEQDDHDHSH